MKLDRILRLSEQVFDELNFTLLTIRKTLIIFINMYGKIDKRKYLKQN